MLIKDGKIIAVEERPEAVFSCIGDYTLADVAIQGRVVIVDEYDEFWANGREGGKDYRSEILTDPTYADLMVVANEIIDTTKDWHHIYFETLGEERGNDLEELANAAGPPPDYRTFYLFLGS